MEGSSEGIHLLRGPCSVPEGAGWDLHAVCWVQTDLQILPFNVHFFLFVSEHSIIDYIGKT